MAKKVAYEFDPFEETGIRVPRDRRDDALEAVSEYVRDKVLEYVGDGKSPVAGGNWKRSLTKGYKKRKGEESSAGFANLELSGDMLDALEVKRKRGSKLILQVEGEEAEKAEGNNIGSYDRDPDPRKAREFIPVNGKTFKREIWSGIKNILTEFEDEEDGES